MDPGPMQSDAKVRARLCEQSRNALDRRAKWERQGWTLDGDDLFEWKDEMNTGFISGASSSAAFRASQSRAGSMVKK